MLIDQSVLIIDPLSLTIDLESWDLTQRVDGSVVLAVLLLSPRVQCSVPDTVFLPGMTRQQTESISILTIH